MVYYCIWNYNCDLWWSIDNAIQHQYRICLLSLVIIAVIGGILYYTNENGNKSTKGEGTFVTKFVERMPFS